MRFYFSNGKIVLLTIVSMLCVLMIARHLDDVKSYIPDDSLGNTIASSLSDGVEQPSQPGSLNDTNIWELGGINSAGVEYKTTAVLRTKSFISSEISLVYAENDYVFSCVVYDANGRFLGFWDNKRISDTPKKLYYLNPAGLTGYKIRLLCQRLGADSIGINECEHILMSSSAVMNLQPTLTFIDDDGSLDALLNWESICDELGIRITAALVTNSVGDGTHVSWDEVERLQNKGFEFVSHTANHINIVNSSDEKCIKDFEASIAALREHGCEYRYLVYPYNSITSEKTALVKQYFDAGIGLGGSSGNPGSDNTLPLYTYWIRRFSINLENTTTKVEHNGEIIDARAFKDLETLKGYIDAAVANGSWVIIMTHLRSDGDFYFDDDVRNMIVNLCGYATEKGVAIQTFGEAFPRYQNYVESGNQSIYGNPHYIVDCNGVVHYRAKCDEGVHPEEIIPGYAATCTQPGLTDGTKCYICGKLIKQQVEIPIGDHTYDNAFDADCNLCGHVCDKEEQ